jgi:uncharacterized protein (DUF2461 family)
MQETVSDCLSKMHSYSFHRIFTGFHTGAHKNPNGCFYIKIAAISSYMYVQVWGANLMILKFKAPRIGDRLTRHAIEIYTATSDKLPSTHEMMISPWRN